MHIGQLGYEKTLAFTHIGSNISFAPVQTDSGAYKWAWNQLFDTGVDVMLKLDRESYVGAAVFTVSDTSLTDAYVLADGIVSGKYHAVEGSPFGGRITIPVGVRAKSVTIRLYADFKTIVLDNIEVLGAYDDGIPLVWPTPKSVIPLHSHADIAQILPASDDPDEVFAAEFLCQRLTEKLGRWRCEEGIAVVVKKQPSYEGERYTVQVSGATVTVSGNARISLLYATDTLLSLTDRRGLFLANVDDAPSQKLRGFHFALPHRNRMEFVRLLFRYVLIPMRYNAVFLEFAGAMRFDRHPEISEGWLRAIQNADAGKQPYMPHSDKAGNRSLLEKEDVRRLVGYIKELGLALIPEVQSLSHVQYITYAHPEIAEFDQNTVIEDTRFADARPAEFYAHCYCPSNPKSYEIIYDIIDEIVEVTEPSGYVHMGHDEVYHLGLCETCRQKDPSDLFADHVIAMHDYLAQKNLKMMMWADMLQPAPITKYQVYKQIDRLPRDIILLDFIWYGHPEIDVEDTLLSHGFRVAVGNLYSSHYPRFRSRIHKDGIIGGEVSMWLAADEEIFAKNGKLWDLLYLSQMLWNSENYEEANRKSYTKLLSDHIQPAVRDAIRYKLRPEGYHETRLCVKGDSSGLPRELLALCKEAMHANSMDVSVSGAYDRLVFEHATLNAAPRIVKEPHFTVGEYQIEYVDGSAVSVTVRYAENVMCYRSGYAVPKKQQYYRHFGYVGTWFLDPVYEGKTACGEDMTVCSYIWENPHPKKEILRITYRQSNDDYCHSVLAGIRGLR